MRLSVKPYGVLGTVMSRSGTVAKVMAEPAPGLPILDPAGLHHINNGPRGAGGAAGQIYRWLGIAEDDAFPEQVTQAIQAPLQAKLHFYGLKGVLHVVGPNFYGRDCSREQALEELSEAIRVRFRLMLRLGLKLAGPRGTSPRLIFILSSASLPLSRVGIFSLETRFLLHFGPSSRLPSIPSSLLRHPALGLWCCA